MHKYTHITEYTEIIPRTKQHLSEIYFVRDTIVIMLTNIIHERKRVFVYYYA